MAALAAAVAIWARLAGLPAVEWVAKPLATVLILAFALGSAPLPSLRYRGLIAAGLLCSLVGDFLLVLPGDLFLAGLLAFLAAHVCYLTAFRAESSGPAPTGLLLLLLLVGGGLLLLIWPALGNMRVPVTGYVAVILAMWWAALGRWRMTGAPGSARAAAGATLFVLSDSLLAIDRFRWALPLAPLLILGAYYAAQLLIASSIGWSKRA
jgi:uncharacterized membrane protein YhhN